MEKICSVLILILLHVQFLQSQSISFRFRIVTWNVGNSKPDCNTFEQLAFTSVADGIKADLIVFGFQEISNNLLELNSVHKILKYCLQKNDYKEIVSDYVGSSILKPIQLYIYITNKIKQSKRVELLKYNNEPTLKINLEKILGNTIGYKGVIASRIQIDNIINLVFINMHLPAGEGKNKKRCKLWSKFLEEYENNNFKDDYLFAFGDQNWRTQDTLSIDSILQAIKKKNYQTILDHDELQQMHQNNNIDNSKKCLSNFFEAPITFPPTYKYLPNSDEYQTEKNNEDRRPSYTDRILVSKISKDLKILQYSTLNDIKLSDHRPVYADILFVQKSKND